MLSFCVALGRLESIRQSIIQLKLLMLGSGLGQFKEWSVVAQVEERSLPTPELRCSNLVIGKNYIVRLLSTVLKRRK